MISQHKKLDEIINVSLSETITRSIFTSLTLLFVLVTTFLFGPESMRGFILVLIYGTVIGTYSSLFLASSLLFQFNKNTVLKVYEKKVMSDDDKVVV
jgi:preprotein translocase subunit SecF